LLDIIDKEVVFFVGKKRPDQESGCEGEGRRNPSQDTPGGFFSFENIKLGRCVGVCWEE